MKWPRALPSKRNQFEIEASILQCHRRVIFVRCPRWSKNGLHCKCHIGLTTRSSIDAESAFFSGIRWPGLDIASMLPVLTSFFYKFFFNWMNFSLSRLGHWSRMARDESKSRLKSEKAIKISPRVPSIKLKRYVSNRNKILFAQRILRVSVAPNS